ncbi:VWA domain-containing protein [Mycolicibacterium vinylchloridicum]|uniref:VWA domain-containing protein n=1 Tax=Mycolicibacterium vinylchloridicum TaxID=2736928 RepID=UPI0015C9050F|nr:VWA domain-containing protein [Mycolicibacterium vinylchloridicum]
MLALNLSAIAGIAAPAAQADPATTTTNDAYNPVIVVLDTSGSMSDKDDSGTERIVGARSAVLGLVDALPPQTQFALIAYPGNGARVANGCSEGKVEIKLGPLDQPTTAAAVRRLTPDGDTPTAPALRHAAELIKNSPTQRGTVVLVSDGESNCGSNDVCQVAKDLSAQGVEVRVNTVGFQINDKGADELTCIAKSTGGRYIDAKDKDQLRDAVEDLSGAKLTLEASVPDPLAVVSGSGADGPKVVVKVANSGRKAATDVRVSVDFRDDANHPGALLVPRPIQFLGNLDPGQSRQLEVTVRPDAAQVDKKFSWTVVATAVNARPQRRDGTTTTAEPTLNGLLTGVDSIAVLGDSYSSGEGAGDYDSGTDGVAGNKCHRSANAYGRVLGAKTVTLIACSGAVTADFYDQQKSNDKPVEPQLRRLRRLALSKDSPDAVLLSIGGNDADFAGTVKWCILAGPGQTCSRFGPIEEGQYRRGAADRISAIADSVRRVYRDVNRAVNDSAARANRDDKYAPIIVVPYPRIVPSAPAGASAAGNCEVAINANEVAFFNDFIDMLNLELMAAVGSLRSQHIPIFVASDVIPAFQPNHTICDATNSYANFSKNLLTAGDQEQLHPNAAGNKAMARAISAWSATKTMMTDPAEVSWVSLDAKKLNPLANAFGNATLGAADLYLVGGDARIDANGFAPSSTVVFRLDSTPRILGSAKVGADGSIRDRVPLPVDIRPGEHHLHAMGIGADGALRDVSNPVRVVPSHTVGALFGLVAGLVALVLGGVGLWRNRASTS